MKYVIEYEQLKDELVTNDEEEWCFNHIKDNANNCKLELSDEDFEHFFNLKLHGAINVKGIMRKMSTYKMSLTEALVNYIIN